jgi:L-iditol 2-dehydrogenase
VPVMRAAVYYNNSDVRLEEVPRPTIGADEILVKVMASGICGSDVLEWYRSKKAPIVLGHEIAGIIDAVGENVDGFAAGDRVFVSHHVPCNTCRYCSAGNHTVCETLHTTNFDPGGFAEYIRVPAINVAIGTFKLPDGMSFDEGTFVEPLGCVIRGQRTAGGCDGKTVLVMGSGISGLLHIVLARATGAERVIATDINPYKLGRALELGAHHAIDARDDVPSRVTECNGDRGADLIVVCTGAMSAFRDAMVSVDRAGSILCFATTEPGDDLEVPINTFWRNSVTILSSYAAAPRDLEEAIEVIADGMVDVNPLITHRYPLERAGEAFRMMAGGHESIKILLYPHGRA